MEHVCAAELLQRHAHEAGLLRLVHVIAGGDEVAGEGLGLPAGRQEEVVEGEAGEIGGQDADDAFGRRKAKIR